MKYNFLVLFFFVSITVFSQFEDLSIKNRFDSVYNEAVTYWDYDSKLMHSGSKQEKNLHQCIIGSSFAPSLDALLIMYETTKDKAYLQKFIKQAIKIYNSRSDKFIKEKKSIYWCDETRIYMNARILWPLAHFVTIINSDTLLKKEKIDSINKKDFVTYNEFAHFLNSNNLEVTDFLISRFWIRNRGMFKPRNIDDSYSLFTKNNLMELNMQASFGCSLIYMYLSNLNRIDYKEKVVQMAKLYHQKATFNFITKKKIKKETLQYIDSIDAYVWNHSGWSSSGSKYKEDIGHASFDILFPILFNRYGNILKIEENQSYFDQTEMKRLNNTFIKLISKNYRINHNFTATVDGENIGYYYGDNKDSPSEYDQLGFNLNAKNWIELSEVDTDLNSGVYSTLMSYYELYEQHLKIGESGYRPEGIDIRGLANLYKYQQLRKRNKLKTITY